MGVCMCKCGYVTWAGDRCRSWWSLPRSVPPASAYTSWTDRGSRRSGPAPRRTAGAMKTTDEKITVGSWSQTKRLNVLRKVEMLHRVVDSEANACVRLPLLSSYWARWGGSRGPRGSGRVYPCSRVQHLPFPTCPQSFARENLPFANPQGTPWGQSWSIAKGLSLCRVQGEKDC